MILAAFLNPGFWYMGLAAMSVPILIHLLSKRRYHRIRWAAIDFLIRAHRENRQRMWWREIVLLALRCLAIALLGLTLARPYTQVEDRTAWASGKKPTRHILVLDDSYSMAFREGTVSTYDRARENLLSTLDQILNGAPSDTVSIWRTQDSAQPWYGPVSAQEPSNLTVRARSESLEVSQLPARFERIWETLLAETEAETDTYDWVFYISSDFQKRDWLSSGQKGVTSLLQLLERKSARLVLLPATLTHRDNSAITGLAPVRSRLVESIENPMRASVTSFRAEPHSIPQVELLVDQLALPALRVGELAPREEKHLPFDADFPTIDAQQLKAILPPDGLLLDNQRFYACHVLPAIRVLVVNGEPGSETIDDEVALLKTALRPEGAVSSGVEVTLIEETQLGSVDFQQYHVVILANVYRILEEAVQRLEAYATEGGGLVVFGGDQVDPVWYNKVLWKSGEGLLPCMLEPAVTIPDNQVAPTLVRIERDHSMLTALDDEGGSLMGNAGFWQYLDCRVDDGDVADGGASGSRILARYSDVGGRIALIERRFGKGKVVLCTSSADLEWNSWGRTAGYVITVLEMAYYLARGLEYPNAYRVGETIVQEFPFESFQSEVRIQAPDYPVSPERVLHGQLHEGQYRVSWPAEQLGVYTLRLRRSDGTETDRSLAVNLDTAESELAACSKSELEQSIGFDAFEYIEDVSSVLDDPLKKRQEYWPIVLWVLVFVLMLEHTLAWRLGR